MLNNKKDRIFLGSVILVQVLFFLLACCYKRIYMGDSFEYIYEAVNIKRYFFFYSGNPAMPILPEYMTQRQPLYPLFLLCVYMFTVNNWLVLVLQNIISVFNIYYIRKQLFRICYHEKYDRLLLLLIIAYPSQFINANTIAPDILLQAFTVLYVGSFISFFQQGQLRNAAYMSLWLIAGFFVKPVLYPFVVVHILILIAVAVRNKMLLQRVVLLSIMPLCAVLLYSYWNYTRTGKFHFSSNQAFNAIYYYGPYITEKYGRDSADHYLKNERAAIATIPEYKDQYNYANEQGFELLKQNFVPYILFHLKNSARIFIEPGKAEMDLFTGHLTYGQLYHGPATGFYATLKSNGLDGMGEYMRNNPSLFLVIPILLFNVIRLIGFILFLFCKRIHWLIRLFVFILVSYFAVAAGPIANTRYFLPVSLLVIGTSVIGFIKRKDISVTT